MEKYDIYSKFDFQKHKETYPGYTEVIIYPTGKVEYAIPSHQEKLLSIAMDKLHISKQEIEDKCPEEYYLRYDEWLCEITNCVSVWTNFVLGNPNHIQKAIIKKMINMKILCL